jgi:hypothetical protein
VVQRWLIAKFYELSDGEEWDGGGGKGGVVEGRKGDRGVKGVGGVGG